MLAAGFLSVMLYRRRCPATHVTAGMGARLGALTGGLGFRLFSPRFSRSGQFSAPEKKSTMPF